MRVVPIEELEVNDKVVVQLGPSVVKVYTVKEVLIDEGLIMFKEMEPLDYDPEDPDQVVVLDDE